MKIFFQTKKQVDSACIFNFSFFAFKNDFDLTHMGKLARTTKRNILFFLGALLLLLLINIFKNTTKRTGFF
jgi:hypothetical protein